MTTAETKKTGSVVAAFLTLVEVGYTFYRSYFDYPKRGRGGEDEAYKIHTIDPPAQGSYICNGILQDERAIEDADTQPQLLENRQSVDPTIDTIQFYPPLPPAPPRQVQQQQEEEIEIIYSPGSLRQQQPARLATTYPQYPSYRQQPRYTSVTPSYNRPAAAPTPVPARRLLLDAPASR
ncbi:hypothetical protein BGX28_000792 [Mortierella sp. GBA30]|nr:hypothetical protein BGX28_000792 [Mortierella sp. GBA30]